MGYSVVVGWSRRLVTPNTSRRSLTRIGEILSVRWEDTHLGAEHPTVTISGTIVYLKGKGFFRQEWTKSDAGYWTVILPRFAVGMLLARKLTAADNPHDAIFASRRVTWMSPHNVRRQWRLAPGTCLEWVTPHTFRKTVTTLIDDEADTEDAVAQLGHGSKEIAKKHYIVKPALAPDSSHILEKRRQSDDNHPCSAAIMTRPGHRCPLTDERLTPPQGRQANPSPARGHRSAAGIHAVA